MPSQTTTKYCRPLLHKHGYSVETVEQWVPFRGGRMSGSAKYRKDFGGFADLLAWHPNLPGVLAIQTCTYSSVSNHIQKIQNDPSTLDKLLDWLRSQNRFEIWGWHKGRNSRNRIAMLLRPRRADLFNTTEFPSVCFLKDETELPDWQKV